MKLKKLREQRVEKLNKLDAILESLEPKEEGAEVRALTEEEHVEIRALEKEIKDIDNTISDIELRRAMESDDENAIEDLKEKRSKDELEKRALESFFRGEILEPEVRRMLTTSGNNQATIPLTISKTLMKKLEEQCPILDEAKRFSTKGTLRLLREDSYGQAAVTAENASFHDEDPTFESIELTSYKITAKVDATFEIAA